MVAKASPTLATSASADVTIGGQVSDTATIASGYSPGGQITFKAYGPNDADCSGVAAFTDTEPVTGNGAYVSADFTPTQPGTYRWTADYSGDANNNTASSACNAPGESVNVAKRTPTLSTSASANITIGSGQIRDTATIAGGANPGGTITFKAYGPDNANCSGAAAFTDTKNVTGNGNYDSADFTPTTAGTYRWTADYSGDAINNSATSACNAAGESVVVAKASPTLQTNASGAITIGGQVHDTATLAAGHSPAGQVTFKAYGPDDANCSGPAAFTDTKNVGSGNGAYDSADFTPAQAGAYRWTADYSGDANNNAASSACNAPGESVAVAKQSPTLTTQASANTTIGNQIRDTATLAAGHSPGGTITFKAYGPGDANCSGPTAFTDTKNVSSGNGAYDSADFTPTQVGAYRWTADYSGDANNNPAASACNAPGESVTVAKRSPTLTTTASQNVTIAGQIRDTATLAGAHNPSGTISFRAYGPDDANCSGTPAFTDTKNVTANGAYASAAFTPTAPGTYRWSATYSGDASNEPAASVCNAPSESVSVAKASPTIQTQSSADIVLGGEVRDTATLAAGHNPSGQITFRLFGPDDASCSGGAVFTDSVAVTANGSYDSAAFTPTAPGTYRWVADYSGDAANNPAASACNAPGESVVVSAPGGDDTTPPQTSFRHVPTKPDPKISFYTFVSSEPGSTFMCSLNREKFKPCKSPVVLRDLKFGRYSFRVFAIDPAGNRDPTAARDRFRVDDPDKGPRGDRNF